MAGLFIIGGLVVHGLSLFWNHPFSFLAFLDTGCVAVFFALSSIYLPWFLRGSLSQKMRLGLANDASGKFHWNRPLNKAEPGPLPAQDFASKAGLLPAKTAKDSSISLAGAVS